MNPRSHCACWEFRSYWPSSRSVAAIIVSWLSANCGTCEQPRAWHSTLSLGSKVLNPKPGPPISDLALSQKIFLEDSRLSINCRKLNSSGQYWEIQTFSRNSRKLQIFGYLAVAAASEIKIFLGLLSSPGCPAWPQLSWPQHDFVRPCSREWHSRLLVSLLGLCLGLGWEQLSSDG